MSFSKKRIDVTLSLGKGAFGEEKGPDVTFTGLRVQATIIAPGGGAMSRAQVRIFGLPLDVIKQMTSIAVINGALRAKNSMLISAGSDEDGMTTVYSGSIEQAWGDFHGIPDVALNVIGLSGLSALVKPVGARSYLGSVSVAVICQDIAKSMGMAFENNNVAVQLSNPYFPGTDLMQLRSCTQAAGISYIIDRDVLAIWPKNGARSGDPVKISKDTGLVGYPAFTGSGVGITTVFNPAIKAGGYVFLETGLEVANGRWLVPSVAHSLESETPGGQWFSQVVGIQPRDQ